MNTIIEASEPPSEKRKKCENSHSLMLAISESHKQALIFIPRCKQWSCPACAEINASKWAVFARQTSAYITDKLYFVTITARPKHKDLATSMIAFTDAWKRVLSRIRYYNSLVDWHGTHANPKRFIYLAIPEQHKTGRMHLHLITNQWYFMRLSKLVPDRYKKKLVTLRWKDIALESGLGYQSKVEPVNTGKVVHYVTKYLSKELGKNDWPDGFRRIRVSRSWPRLSPENIGDWQFRMLDENAKEFNRQMEIDLIVRGYTVSYCDHLESWAVIDSFENLFGGDVD